MQRLLSLLLVSFWFVILLAVGCVEKTSTTSAPIQRRSNELIAPVVMPANAGIQEEATRMDASIRWHDKQNPRALENSLVPCSTTSECKDGLTCQNLTTLTFEEVGRYCLSKQTKRDGLCQAVTDDQACSDNRICAISSLLEDENGKPVARSFVCRDACPYGTPDANDSCETGELCTPYAYSNTTQTKDGKPVTCTEVKCQGDNDDCECDMANGFKCEPLIPDVIAFCERKAGICGKPVRLVTYDDFTDQGFTGELCDEVTGHAFCDTSLLEGVSNPAQTLCIPISEKNSLGICLALCSGPDFNLACPENYECSTQLARKLGLPEGFSTCEITG